jgi:hypothetical protein
MRKFFLVLCAVALTAYCLQAQQAQPRQARETRFHGQFIENFDGPASRIFDPLISATRDSLHRRYTQGIPSISDKETHSIMLFRIDPEDPRGAGRGPEIISKDFTHFGSYATRIRVPDATKVQPDVGVVVGYFTYHVDSVYGLSEVDIEWLIADPEVIYVGTWTGPGGNLQRVGRIINLAKGIVYETSYRVGQGRNTPLTGLQSQPETIQPIENYNAASQFYTYGWDWYPDRIVWWMLHPTTEERIILWDYSGSAPGFTGIPLNPSRYRLNFWHTHNWPVHTRPNSIEPPLYTYGLEIDWMSYTPFEDLNRAWQEQNR